MKMYPAEIAGCYALSEAKKHATAAASSLRAAMLAFDSGAPSCACDLLAIALRRSEAIVEDVGWFVSFRDRHDSFGDEQQIAELNEWWDL